MPPSDLSLKVPPSCRPGDHGKTKRAFPETVEEYVEGIFKLDQAFGRVTMGELAEYMQVSAGSATSMVKKLDSLGLANYTPYKSVELTRNGLTLAKMLTRTHRVLKSFLVEMVGLPWNDVHELACKLEHYISVDVIDQMYEKLGKPERCPHGNPIDPDLEDECFQLAKAHIGDKLEVVKITNEGHDFLRFMEEIALMPGVRFTAVGATEFDGLIHLEIGANPRTVGREVSRHVWVKRVN